MSERMASSDARPPALRMTCASPSFRPRNFAGCSRASMHATMATARAGGMPSPPWVNPSAYVAFASSIVSSSAMWGLLRRSGDAERKSYGCDRNRTRPRSDPRRF